MNGRRLICGLIFLPIIACCSLSSSSRNQERVIAYLSKSDGTIRVVEAERAAVSAAMRAEIVSDTEWIVRRGDQPAHFHVVPVASDHIDALDPKEGDEEIVKNRKCTGSTKGQDTGCVASDVGSQRVVRTPYFTCEKAPGSTCEQKYIGVTIKYSYVDTACQNETARTIKEWAWVCVP